MNQRTKKLAATLIAAGFATVSFAVTASATKTDTVYKSTPYGTMTGKLEGWCAGGIASTSVPNPANTIIAGVVGDNTEYFPHNVITNYNSTSAYATTGTLGNRGDPASFWGSREVRDGAQGYGEYTAVTNCTCP